MANLRNKSKRAAKRAMLIQLTITLLTALIFGAVGGVSLYQLAPSLHLLSSPKIISSSGSSKNPNSSLPSKNTPTTSLQYTVQQFNNEMISYQTTPLDKSSVMRLIIPAININVPIVERGLEQGWMVVAPGMTVTHFIYSAYPGASGNSLLYSHGNMAFRNIDKLQIGEAIYVQTPSGSSLFKVSQIRIVSPNDLSILDNSDTPILTLLTCYPFGVDSMRYVVIAAPA